MDMNFVNVYSEVLKENLDAVLNQNFMFQAQLKISEKSLKEKDELQKKFDLLLSENEQLKSSILNKDKEFNQFESVKQKASQLDSVLSEKQRIQDALNQSLQKITQLESEIETLKNPIDVKKSFKSNRKTTSDVVVESGGTF
jgi:chromosome segregation ATPase